MNRLARVGVIGTPGGLLLAEHKLEEALEVLGMNSGNMMFQYALWKIVKNPKIDFTFARLPDINYLKEAIDVLCIPAANQLSPEWDIGWWADFIEQLDRPVVIAGLGLQSLLEEDINITLQAGTHRFLKVVAERAVHVGVRGETTLRFLQKEGITNGIVTGCPSNFINVNVSGASINDKIVSLANKNDISSVRIVGTLEPHTRSTELRLINLLNSTNNNLVFQTNIFAFEVINGNIISDDAMKYFNWERRILSPHSSDEEYINMVKSGKFYVDVKTWIDEAGRFDLNIGQRIHGAIAAIQGHGLGICVAFDSRTLELASTMGYPYVMANELDRISRVQDLPAIVHFSAEAFDRKRAELRASLKLCLEQHGVVTHL